MKRRGIRAIPNDAEPFYELGCRTKHGYKPVGEAGISGATARTAGELGRPVTERGFDNEGNAIADGHFVVHPQNPER